MTNQTSTKGDGWLFRRLGIATVAAVYLLVLAGGIVRSTGSGMGCPDWPKCFGSWVPPTEVAQLPLRYQETYASKRQLKNERLAGYLDKMGFGELAGRIRLDAGPEAGFNATKTWIEYVNRLLGVLVGFLIFLTLVLSGRYWREDRTIFWVSLAAFGLVGVQGWIGSVVVSTNLLPGIITVHMLLAIAIVLLLIYAVARSYRGRMPEPRVANKPFLNRLVLFALAISLAQVLLGTQVRESVDHAIRSLGYGGRAQWIDALGLSFYVHRSFSWLVLATHVYLIYQVRKNISGGGRLYKYAFALLLVVGLEVATGAAMAYLGVPAYLQPVHLLLAFAGIGIQFLILLVLNARPVTAEKDRMVGARVLS
ncbi:MAG: COX15/CtaA family protein [Ferruginibacter sp.]|nr:COX15/CtaA family protein [Cytophagales bacterium]